MKRLIYIMLFIPLFCEGQKVIEVTTKATKPWVQSKVAYMIDSTDNYDTVNVHYINIDNRVKIDSVNGIKLEGTTTVWDDLRTTAAYTKLGANNLPAYDFDSMALKFVSDADTNEIAYFNVQMPHAWNDSSNLYCHFHWIQTAVNDSFVFHLAYRIYPLGQPASGWKYISLIDCTELPYTSGVFHQIAEFQPILLNGIESSFIDLKLYRYGSYGITNVFVKGFDLHYEIEKLGTPTEY